MKKAYLLYTKKPRGFFLVEFGSRLFSARVNLTELQKDLDGDDVTVDGNHPLAGQRLNFQVKIIDIRDASQEEVAHGHVHGEGGHHH